MQRKPKKRVRHANQNHFSVLTRQMMETPAWHALCPKTQALSPWIRFEWHGPKINKSEKLQFSCRQAASAMKIDVSTAMQTFRELQAKGYLHVTICRHRQQFIRVLTVVKNVVVSRFKCSLGGETGSMNKHSKIPVVRVCLVQELSPAASRFVASLDFWEVS